MDTKKVLDSFLDGKKEASKTPQTPSKASRNDVKTIVKPQIRMNPKEKDYFFAVAEHLQDSGLLSSVDSLVLTMLGKNFALLAELYDRTRSVEDYFQTNPNGVIHASAEANLIKDTESQILKLSTKLGLSPQDRTKIFGAIASAEAMRNKKAEGDALDEY
jgi:P27 family predicted phage terminase small subunit